jgi:hypothetical protein
LDSEKKGGTNEQGKKKTDTHQDDDYRGFSIIHDRVTNSIRRNFIRQLECFRGKNGPTDGLRFKRENLR